jgi:hypothetical protein
MYGGTSQRLQPVDSVHVPGAATQPDDPPTTPPPVDCAVFIETDPGSRKNCQRLVAGRNAVGQAVFSS